MTLIGILDKYYNDTYQCSKCTLINETTVIIALSTLSHCCIVRVMEIKLTAVVVVTQPWEQTFLLVSFFSHLTRSHANLTGLMCENKIQEVIYERLVFKIKVESGFSFKALLH